MRNMCDIMVRLLIRPSSETRRELKNMLNTTEVPSSTMPAVVASVRSTVNY